MAEAKGKLELNETSIREIIADYVKNTFKAKSVELDLKIYEPYCSESRHRIECNVEFVLSRE